MAKAQPDNASRGQTPLLIIDDDKKLCRLLHDYLEPMGYWVDMAHDGASGLATASEREYAMIILDVMMPGMDGFEVLKSIRKTSSVPVLMLTARGEEPDRIVGLEIGADDYLPKTASTRELLARIRAILRRTSAPQPALASQPEIVAGELRLNTGSRVASMRDVPIPLTPVEFDLLSTLMEARGRVKTREQLLEAVRDRDYDVFDRSIDVHISTLRKKLGDDPKEPRYIKTIRAAGYMFISPG